MPIPMARRRKDVINMIREEIFKIDISYLFSNSKIRNPLENTLRFSLAFNLIKKQTEVLDN